MCKKKQEDEFRRPDGEDQTCPRELYAPCYPWVYSEIFSFSLYPFFLSYLVGRKEVGKGERKQNLQSSQRQFYPRGRICDKHEIDSNCGRCKAHRFRLLVRDLE